MIINITVIVLVGCWLMDVKKRNMRLSVFLQIILQYFQRGTNESNGCTYGLSGTLRSGHEGQGSTGMRFVVYDKILRNGNKMFYRYISVHVTLLTKSKLNA